MNTNDFVPPFDPTGYADISGTQLYQYLFGAAPSSDRGVILTTTDVAGVPVVPDAENITKLQRYIWLRIGAAATTPYIWNPNASKDVTMLKWQSVAQSSIGPGIIVNSMIADNTITDAKIASITWEKIINPLNNIAPSGAAGGDLAGTYPNPDIDAGAVTTSKLGDLSVTSDKIANATIAVGKLAPVSGSAKDMARVNAGATTMEAFTPPLLFTNTAIVPATNANKVPRVNAGGTDWEMYNPNSTTGIPIGLTLQLAAKTITGGAESTDVIPLDNTIPQVGEGTQYITMSFTPKSASSLLHISFSAWVAGSSRVTVALFVSGSDDARVVNISAVTSNGQRSTCLDFVMSSPGTSAITIAVRFGTDSGTAYINTQGDGALYGAAAKSFLKVEEIVGSLT